MKAINILDTAMTTGAVTDDLFTKVPMASISRTNREFNLVARVTENSTAPGGGRTITPNLYWCDEDLGAQTNAEAILRLAGRKSAQSAVTRRNTASSVRYYKLNATVIRPEAAYLYVSFDKTTEDSGSVPTIKVDLVPVPSTTL